MANAAIRTTLICATGLLGACGGGNGGSADRPATPLVPDMPVAMNPPVTPTPPVPPAMPTNALSVQGLYVGSDPDDGNVFVLITPDARALIRLERTNVPSIGDDFEIVDTALVPAPPSATRRSLIESSVVAAPDSATDYFMDSAALVTTLDNATAYSSLPSAIPGPVPISAVSGFVFPTNPALKPLIQVGILGSSAIFALKPLPSDFNTASSLDRIANTYTQGTFSLTIDSAGQVSGLDSSTNCAITGNVIVDMPTINAYALQLKLSMCADMLKNGSYSGRASVLDRTDNARSLLILAHSSFFPLNIPVLKTATP